MVISDHSYAGLLMKKRRNVEQKESQNRQSGSKGALRNVAWEPRTVLGEMRPNLSGSAPEGGQDFTLLSFQCVKGRGLRNSLFLKRTTNQSCYECGSRVPGYTPHS